MGKGALRNVCSAGGCAEQKMGVKLSSALSELALCTRGHPYKRLTGLKWRGQKPTHPVQYPSLCRKQVDQSLLAISYGSWRTGRRSVADSPWSAAHKLDSIVSCCSET